VIKVGGKQKPYEMWQAGNSLAASPLVDSFAGFEREYGGSAARSPAPESRQLRRLDSDLFPMSPLGEKGSLTCLLEPFLSLAAVTAQLQVAKPIFYLSPSTVLLHVTFCRLLSTFLLVPRLKGHCHDKAQVRS